MSVAADARPVAERFLRRCFALAAAAPQPGHVHADARQVEKCGELIATKQHPRTMSRPANEVILKRVRWRKWRNSLRNGFPNVASPPAMRRTSSCARPPSAAL
jgi:hypothetical protein